MLEDIIKLYLINISKTSGCNLNYFCVFLPNLAC